MAYNDSWLGLRKDGGENGEWKWLDGTPYNWQNWEPSQSGKSFECARMWSNSGQWSAMKVNCNEKRPYICKKGQYTLSYT